MQLLFRSRNGTLPTSQKPLEINTCPEFGSDYLILHNLPAMYVSPNDMVSHFLNFT